MFAECETWSPIARIHVGGGPGVKGHRDYHTAKEQKVQNTEVMLKYGRARRGRSLRQSLDLAAGLG